MSCTYKYIHIKALTHTYTCTHDIYTVMYVHVSVCVYTYKNKYKYIKARTVPNACCSRAL